MWDQTHAVPPLLMYAVAHHELVLGAHLHIVGRLELRILQTVFHQSRAKATRVI